MGNLLLVVISRSKNKGFIQTLRLPNIAQYWITGVAIGLFLIVVSIPFLRDRFKFTELTAASGILILFAGMISLFWFEAVKYLKTRKSL